MLLATIVNETLRESRQITRSRGASAPACLQFSDNVCGYWESRFELFIWACDEAGFDPYETLYVSGTTGEVLAYEELVDEDYEEAIYRYYQEKKGDH